MKKILNLTQHVGSTEQKAEGLVEPKDKEEVQFLLTLTELPTSQNLVYRAEQLVAICEEWRNAMILSYFRKQSY